MHEARWFTGLVVVAALAGCGSSGGACRAGSDPAGCAPTYDEAIAQATCGVSAEKYASGPCGAHLVATSDHGVSAFRACFYAPDTRRLVGSYGSSENRNFCDGSSSEVSWGEGSSACTFVNETVLTCPGGFPDAGAGGG